MFGGAYELSIDSKGRLAIPAKFRELLARHYSPFLVGTLEKRSHLLLYGMRLQSHKTIPRSGRVRSA